MKVGVALARCNPAFHLAVARAADALGFESLWMADHLVFPVDMSGSPHPGADLPPVPPTTPVFDAFTWLAHLAAHTERVRLGTNVYLLGLRHPFAAARAVQTLDQVSGGRALFGVGAGWLREEWHAAGLDPRTRGRRLDESLEVCRRLWSEDVIEHHGEFFDFGPVAFEPKPVQRPHPPIHVGGDSLAALRRAARHDGWYGLQAEPAGVARQLARLDELRREAGRGREPFEVTAGADVTGSDDVKRWEDAGVDRLVVAPWKRSPDAVDGLRRAAEWLLR